MNAVKKVVRAIEENEARKSSRLIVAMLVSTLSIVSIPAWSIQPGGDLPVFDARELQPAPQQSLDGSDADRLSNRNLAEERLKGGDPNFRVTYDSLFDTPSHVRSTTRFLTAPAPGVDAMVVLNGFIDKNLGLLQLDPSSFPTTRVLSDYVTAHNGVRHIQLQQTINGLDLVGAILGANFTKDGELINLSSSLLPDAGSVSLTAWNSAENALETAAANTGISMSQGITRLTSANSNQIQFAQTDDFANAPTAQLIYFPMSRTDFRLAWKVTVPEIGLGNIYETYVDSNSSDILYRSNLTKYFGDENGAANTSSLGSSLSTEDASLLVYDIDSPTPVTGTQLRTLKSMLTTQHTYANVNGWMTDGTSITDGNNVEAYIDADNNNLPDPGSKPAGTSYRVFNYAMNLALAPSTYQPASVTHLYFANNYMHDRLWAVGFDEASGNFQTNNYGRGGLGNDRVQAESQDGGGTNNANFATPPDGSRPRMQMYIGTNFTPNHDGSFDTHVVFHEYGHGWSIRLVGGPAVTSGLNNLQQMGEGLADVVGMLLLAEPGDEALMADPYRVGTYLISTSGIRPFPYSTSLITNPHTYSSIGSGVSVPHGVGSVWAEISWVVTSKLTATHGFAGFELMLQLLTDGLKLCPTSPTFIDLRDAILQADLINNGGANQCDLWTGFAERGLGFSATTAGSGSLVATDGFDVSPTGCISSAGVVAFDATEYTCGDTIGILAADLDLAGTVTLDVLVEATGGDWEIVTLNETASGVFSGSLPVQKASVSTNNGTLKGSSVAQTITVTYSDVDTGGGLPADVTDTATFKACPDVLISITLDTDPGWTTEGQWAFGAPTGGGTHNFDPTSGFTGANVYGYNLNGDYPNLMPEHNLTTTPFDFTHATGVQLEFKRWLGVESSTWDHASVDVSADGVTWTTIWDHVGPAISESSWSTQQFDISAIADGESTVYVRWVMGTTDSSVTYPGWNIDDIRFFGSSVAFSGTPDEYDFVLLGCDIEVTDTVPARDGVSIIPCGTTDVQFAGVLYNVVAGTNAADLLSGTPADDLILGFDSADELTASGGNDALIGGNDGDVLIGDAGNNLLAGNAGNDILVTGAGDDSALGGADVDYVVLSDAANPNNSIDGGPDGDALFLLDGYGAYTLNSLSGFEFFVGGDGDDTVDWSSATANMVLLGNGGSDVLTGGSGDDYIDGGADDDTLTGNDGNDGLVGQGGTNLLYPGDGDDAVIAHDGTGSGFVYYSPGPLTLPCWDITLYTTFWVVNDTCNGSGLDYVVPADANIVTP